MRERKRERKRERERERETERQRETERETERERETETETETERNLTGRIKTTSAQRGVLSRLTHDAEVWMTARFNISKQWVVTHPKLQSTGAHFS